MRDSIQTKLLLLLGIVATHGGTLGLVVADNLYFRNQNLTTVPFDSITDENIGAVTKAIFSHNNFNVLKTGDFVHFSQFPKLKYVFFDHNNISDIEGDTFIRISNMKFLDLNHNKLNGISNEMYKDLAKLNSLKYINLKRNPIKKFQNIDKLAAKGIQVDYDGVLGREKQIKMRSRRVASAGSSFYNNNEDVNEADIDAKEEETKHAEDYINEIDDEKNITVVDDKPIKAYVVDHKQNPSKINNANNVKNNFMGSIIFNFLAAFLVLVALPVAMIIYYFIHRNDGIS